MTALDAQLTPRQQEILSLLSAGASNKEIAERLGISIGTVKQHLAGLYKRLNVRNRAMAISRAIERSPRPTRATQMGITRRPCAAMSISLGEDCPHAAARSLQRSLAGLAFDSKAIYLARDRQGGDLVFGIRHRAENLMASVLQIALMLLDELRLTPETLNRISLTVAVGMALVKQRRFGGEPSDDLVASSVVADAHRLSSQAPPGQLLLSAAAISALQAEGLGRVLEQSTQIPLEQIHRLFNQPDDPQYALIGRDREWTQLRQWLSMPGQLLLLEGETGMGKSRLSRQAAAWQLQRNKPLLWLQSLPISPPGQVLQLSTDNRLEAEQIEPTLRPWLKRADALVILDDAHLLTREMRQHIESLWQGATCATLLLAGRRLEAGESALRLHLKRMEDQDIANLITEVAADATTEQIAALTRESAGIPLFARELARRLDGEVPLPLLMMITERLDALPLDWKLLYLLSRGSKAMQLGSLTQAMGEAVAQVEQAALSAVRMGVLTLNGRGASAWLAFHHPLVRRVVEVLGMDWGQDAD